MFKRQNDSLASFYDVNGVDPTINHIYVTRALRVAELLGGIGGFNVLSAGCGVAPMADEVLTRKGVYFGVDLSHDVLQKAKVRHEGELLLLTAGNLEKLPFKSSTFDMLLCLGALEYVDDKDSALDEFYRVVKNSAIIILSMQNKFSLFRLWDRSIYRGQLLNFIRKISRHPVLYKPLEKPASLNSLRKKLISHSFVVMDHLYYNFNFWIKPFDKLFPVFSVATSRWLEVLYRHSLGLIPGDFIIQARKVTSVT
jgi:ubiquinone/menaquinone biosynthesis C-methylase UbiE